MVGCQKSKWSSTWPPTIRPRRSRRAAAYSRQTFPWRSVGRSVGLSSALWKMADRIRVPFGIVGRTGQGMRQMVGFGDRSTGRGTFGGEFGARHCNEWGLNGVRVRQCRDAALFPNYFGKTCLHLELHALLIFEHLYKHSHKHVQTSLHKVIWDRVASRRAVAVAYPAVRRGVRECACYAVNVAA